MYDLVADPLEVNNVIVHPDCLEIRTELTTELARLQQQVVDNPYPGA